MPIILQLSRTLGITNPQFLAFVLLFLSTISMSAATPPIKVTVVGGTHGNEYTGVWCIKSLERRLSETSSNSAALKFPNLRIATFLANPEAHLKNKRFVDEDLNRQFSYNSLGNADPNSCEAKRAKEINQILGPKEFDSSESTEKSKSDVIIDLHTTTTNMGTTLIVGEGNKLMTQCAAYVKAKCGGGSESDCNSPVNNGVHILMHTHKRQQDRPGLSSIAAGPMSIEVGPVPQGVLRHDVVEKTQAALEAALEFLDRHSTEQEALEQELKEYYPDGKVPCYRSAPAKRQGEMSSKIPWPCDPDNENFPSWMVHKSVQDQDFCEISKGDPLFVDLDGNVINYDGSHGSPVRLMFINEGGYYYASSGTGISVARLDHFSIDSGEII